MIARELSLRGGRLRKVYRTRAIRAERAVPAVAVAGYPKISSCRQPTNARNQNNPRNQIPARKQESHARPGLRPAPRPALLVDCLHPTHGGVTVDLRESLLRQPIM